MRASRADTAATAPMLLVARLSSPHIRRPPWRRLAGRCCWRALHADTAPIGAEPPSLCDLVAAGTEKDHGLDRLHPDAERRRHAWATALCDAPFVQVSSVADLPIAAPDGTLYRCRVDLAPDQAVADLLPDSHLATSAAFVPKQPAADDVPLASPSFLDVICLPAPIGDFDRPGGHWSHVLFLSEDDYDIAGDMLADAANRVLLVGSPGIGKTALFYKLVACLARRADLLPDEASARIPAATSISTIARVTSHKAYLGIDVYRLWRPATSSNDVAWFTVTCHDLPLALLDRPDVLVLLDPAEANTQAPMQRAKVVAIQTADKERDRYKVFGATLPYATYFYPCPSAQQLLTMGSVMRRADERLHQLYSVEAVRDRIKRFGRYPRYVLPANDSDTRLHAMQQEGAMANRTMNKQHIDTMLQVLTSPPAPNTTNLQMFYHWDLVIDVERRGPHRYRAYALNLASHAVEKVVRRRLFLMKLELAGRTLIGYQTGRLNLSPSPIWILYLAFFVQQVRVRGGIHWDRAVTAFTLGGHSFEAAPDVAADPVWETISIAKRKNYELEQVKHYEMYFDSIYTPQQARYPFVDAVWHDDGKTLHAVRVSLSDTQPKSVQELKDFIDAIGLMDESAKRPKKVIVHYLPLPRDAAKMAIAPPSAFFLNADDPDTQKEVKFLLDRYRIEFDVIRSPIGVNIE